MNRRALILAGIVLLAGLAGCMGDEEPSDPASQAAETGDVTVEKVVIQEDGVVCYYYVAEDGYAGMGGMSCVPFSEVEGYGG